MSTGPTEDNDPLQLRTKRAWNDKRESFSPNDINDPNKLYRMRASAGLWDDDLNELSIYPKTQARRAHFKLKSGQPRTVLHKDSPDPTHNLAVDAIHELLIKPNTRLRLVAKAWNNAMKRADVQLWEQHILSDYRWHKEPGTRLLMESGDFLQPDLVGVDTSRMNRTAVNPAIVIEVVHHHWPDFDTWRHLEKLSTLNHIVAFYFVTEGLPKDTLASRSSSFESSNEILITSYLRGGDFFTEGKKIARTGDPRVDYEKFDQTAKMAAEKSFEAERKKQKKL